ncbi:uncharacterized protein LOC134232367 isoform X2 [Saccostrea cucullata]|uniref:uncharacterized protein LOC134232367 isoform X2 n=1 Tax=Saccostrea cuccullata TaxID=36930 RepID=UPI002ED42F98
MNVDCSEARMFPRKRKKVEATRSLSEKQGTTSPFNRQKKENIHETNRDKENLQRICVIRTYIVGIQHYKGKNSVSTGSKICLRRNPDNSEDSNAIECCPRPSCPEWDIVGHICKELAVPLAGLMDDDLVNVEGEIIFDAEASTDYLYVKPVRINLSGNYTKKEEIIRKLKRYQYYDVKSHYKTAPMKTRDVDGQKKFMAYDIEEVTSVESKELGLQDMELKHLLVLFALLMEENNQFSLESDDWVKTLNRVNVDFQQPEKPDYILRKTLESDKLENYIFFKNQNLAFKSKQIPGKVIQFISTKENYVEYFVQHASNKGLREYCVTSSQSTSKPAFALSNDQLRKLAERMKYDILSHPVIKDKSIHKTVSETLKIPEVILSWNEDGKKVLFTKHTGRYGGYLPR